jgi:hypothetical protein
LLRATRVAEKGFLALTQHDCDFAK